LLFARASRGGSVNPGKSARQRGIARTSIALAMGIGAKLGASERWRRHFSE
jgi:hypothetical protein